MTERIFVAVSRTQCDAQQMTISVSCQMNFDVIPPSPAIAAITTLCGLFLAEFNVCHNLSKIFLPL